MNELLLPCPFCGGTRTKHKEDCYIYLITTYKWFNCEKAWNTRAERTCKCVDGKCSNCGDMINLVDYAYCRCCGARVMVG